MKPTSLQQKLCDLLIEQISWWKNSNDITSPTHSCDSEQELMNFAYDEGMSDEKAEEISSALHNLWRTIL